jgi:hypothetical protein
MRYYQHPVQTKLAREKIQQMLKSRAPWMKWDIEVTRTAEWRYNWVATTNGLKFDGSVVIDTQQVSVTLRNRYKSGERRYLGWQETFRRRLGTAA